MMKFLALEAPLKASVFKPPEVFRGLSPLTAASYKAAAYSHYTGQSLPTAGLDYKESLEGGGHDFAFGLPINLAGMRAEILSYMDAENKNNRLIAG